MWVISNEEAEIVEAFRDDLGLTLPVLVDDQNVIENYTMEWAFVTAAFPQDWIIGSDGTIQYFNNRFEYEAMVEVIERELAE